MRKQPTAEQAAAAKERRIQFIELSKKLKSEAPKAGEGATESTGGVNAMLLAAYRGETGREDFRTFKGWKDAGYKVKKGERGYPVWSRPIAAIKAEQGKEVTEDEAGHFGTCYLFHDQQVEPLNTVN